MSQREGMNGKINGSDQNSKGKILGMSDMCKLEYVQKMNPSE
jgi:hypothetical protein